MEKLKVKDIKPRGEGLQIKELLYKKYATDAKDTMDDILEKYGQSMGLYGTTLSRYCEDKVLKHDNVKLQLEKDFNNSYDNIIDTVRKQVEQWVFIVKINLDKYDVYEDFKIFEEIIKL